MLMKPQKNTEENENLKRDITKLEKELKSIYEIFKVQNTDEAIKSISNLLKENENLKKQLQSLNNLNDNSNQFNASENSQSENINSPLLQQKSSKDKSNNEIDDNIKQDIQMQKKKK